MPTKFWGFPGGSVVKNPPAMQETQEMQVWSWSREDPLEEGTATHSSILARKIPWAEEPGQLQSMGLQRDMTEWLRMIRWMTLIMVRVRI